MPPKKADILFDQEECRDTISALEEIQSLLKDIITNQIDSDNDASLNLIEEILKKLEDVITILCGQYSSSLSNLKSILYHSLQGIFSAKMNLERLRRSSSNTEDLGKPKKLLMKCLRAIYESMPGFIKAVCNLSKSTTEINLKEMIESYKSLFANIKFIFKHFTKQSLFRLGDNLAWGELFILLLDLFVTNPKKYYTDQVEATAEFINDKIVIKIKYIRKLKEEETYQVPTHSNGQGTSELTHCGITVSKKQVRITSKNVITPIELVIPAILLNPSES